MFFIRLFLASTWEKNRAGGTVLVFSQTAVKGGHGFEIAGRMDKYALEINLVFGCFYVFDIANTEIQTWKEYIK